MKRLSKPVAEFCICGEHAWSPITQGYITFVEPADFWLLQVQLWCLYRTRDGLVLYAKSLFNGRYTSLHSQVFDEANGARVDHKDGDGLNNRRENLREANFHQNGANTRLSRRNKSGFKGVFWNKSAKKWVAGLKISGKRKNLGSFDDPIEAAKAYDREAVIQIGEFATTNFGENRVR